MRPLCLIIALAVGAIATAAAESAPTPAAPPSREAGGPRIRITLKSDGNTWVSITNVRLPAKFESMSVSLPPGDYEVIGRRRGYRDVVKSLQVRSGMPSTTLSVNCTESLN